MDVLPANRYRYYLLSLLLLLNWYSLKHCV